MALSLALLAPLMAAAATPASAPWIEHEFKDPIDVSAPALEAFLNESCAPRDLTGVQIFSIQAGHGDVPHIHIYCRTDHRKGAAYKVELGTFTKGAFGPIVERALADRNTRIGPFYFGATGTPDGLILIHKVAPAK